MDEATVIDSMDFSAEGALGLSTFVDYAARDIPERFPVIHVLAPDGTQYTNAYLEEVTLSDGSKVFNIRLSE